MLASTKRFLVVSFDRYKRIESRERHESMQETTTRWLEEGIGYLLYQYCRFCAGTSRIRMTEGAARYLKLAENRSDPWVVTFWHEDFLLWPIAAQHAALPWSVWIHNDTFGGRLVKSFCRRSGLPTVELVRKSSRKEKLGALLDALRSKGRIGIAADYGEPWFRVHPTASQLARQTHGVVLAMHISAPANPLVGSGNHRLRLPVPFSRYEIRVSPWIDPAKLGGDRQTIQSIESGLWALQTGTLLKAGGAIVAHHSITRATPRQKVAAENSHRHSGPQVDLENRPV